MIVLGNTKQQQSNQYKQIKNYTVNVTVFPSSYHSLKVWNLARNVCGHQGSRMGALGQ